MSNLINTNTHITHSRRKRETAGVMLAGTPQFRPQGLAPVQAYHTEGRKRSEEQEEVNGNGDGDRDIRDRGEMELGNLLHHDRSTVKYEALPLRVWHHIYRQNMALAGS